LPNAVLASHSPGGDVVATAMLPGGGISMPQHRARFERQTRERPSRRLTSMIPQTFLARSFSRQGLGPYGLATLQ